uniref:Uncharacterized protein n=1 Tax=Trichogramma kaykai TaxID=54128 RepID=A0ABD2X0V6_9HYME
MVSPPANSYVSDPCEILLTGLATNVELTDEEAFGKVFTAMGLKNYHKFLANTRAWKPKNRRKPAPENTKSFVFKLSSPSVRYNCMINASKLLQSTLMRFLSRDDNDDAREAASVSLSLAFRSAPSHLTRRLEPDAHLRTVYVYTYTLMDLSYFAFYYRYMFIVAPRSSSASSTPYNTPLYSAGALSLYARRRSPWYLARVLQAINYQQLTILTS